MARNKKIKLKLSSKDFDNSLLPNTRRAQFKDVLTHEYKSLLLLGMWLLIFFVPVIMMETFSNILIFTYIEQNNTKLTPEEMKSFELLFTLVKESSLIIGYMVFSIGIAGALRIIRNLVYGEVLFFKNDFILGIKKYWKLCLLSGLVFGLLKNGTSILNYLVNNYANSSYLYIFSGFAIGFFYIVIVPTIFFFISLSITYELNFSKCLVISVRYALANLIVGLAFSAVLFGLTFIWYIGILLVVIIIMVLSVFLIAPLYILLWHLYVTSKFDKYINEQQFPSVFRKGLRKGE